jgi:O-antigen/teichoic acid export membrane protein
MGKEELGLWFLLGNSQAFLGLLGMGVAPTLTRYIALVKGKSGTELDAVLTQDIQEQLGDLVETGRIVLLCVSVFTFFVALILGSFLLKNLTLQGISPQLLLFVWFLMCAGYAIGVWVSYLDCLLMGIGYVGWNDIVRTVISLLTIILNIIVVFLGYGLIALAIISIITALLQRIAMWKLIDWKKPEIHSIKGSWNYELAKAMFKPSISFWLTGLGAFSLYKTDQYFIALFSGASDVAIYQATYSVIFNLALVSLTPVNSASVFISQFWSNGNIEFIHRFLIKSCLNGLLIMASGFCFFLISGREFFTLWLNGSFIGYPIMTILLVSITLDTQHGLLTGLSRSTNDEKYAFTGGIAGFLNLIFTFILTKRFGLIGVPMGTLLAQLLTNNWYGVYRPLKRLKFPLKRYFSKIIFPILILNSISIVIVFAFRFLFLRLFSLDPVHHKIVFVSLIFFLCLCSLTLQWLLLIKQQNSFASIGIHTK